MTSDPVLSMVAEAKAARSPTDVAAVVFDADGVLVDTEPAWAAARAALFNRHGRAFGEAEGRQTLGTGVAGTGGALSELLGEPDRAGELSAQLLAFLLEEVSKDPPRALPGAVELLDELRGAVPIGVASNSPRILLERSLEAARLAGLFDVVLGVDEVTEAKPAPDLYLTAVERLGAEPGESVAVEDSPAGVASALEAGLFVIGIQSLPQLRLDAHQVVDSLSDPVLRTWLGLSASGWVG